MKNTICPGYTGVACVDGSCPVALRDDYMEYGFPIVHNCTECHFYEGCKDCCFDGTEYCTGEGKK